MPCPGQGSFGVTWVASTQSCPSLDYYFTISIDRAQGSAGTLFALPTASAVRVSYSAHTPDSVYCSSWTGTVNWIADVPSWKLSADLTCSEAGKSAIRITGSFQGDL
jgi:hypothetical protein